MTTKSYSVGQQVLVRYYSFMKGIPDGWYPGTIVTERETKFEDDEEEYWVYEVELPQYKAVVSRTDHSGRMRPLVWLQVGVV